MIEISAASPITIVESGLPGESAGNLARRRGHFIGAPVTPGMTDDEVLDAPLSVMNELVEAAGVPVQYPDVRVASLINITVSNPGTAVIGGATLSNGDRLLLIGQTALAQNGLWVFNGSGSALTRPADFDGAGEAVTGATVQVLEGDLGGLWRLTTQGTITIGTTAQTWLAFSYRSGRKMAFKQDDANAVTRTVSDKIAAMVSPKDWGAVGDGVADDTIPLRRAIAFAAARNTTLDLTGALTAWRITAEVNFTGVRTILANYPSPILVDVTGTYANGFAVEFGDPTTPDGFTGRWICGSIIGLLNVEASSRSDVINAVYLKGHWLNIGHLAAVGFNGTGIYLDNVWDSSISRLACWLCGNVERYALDISADGGDGSNNCTSIQSVQVEQAYHKGIRANMLRYKINNIHSEQLSVLTTDDGDPNFGYLNYDLLISNGSVDQAVLHCLVSGTAPDGSALAAAETNIRLTGSEAAFNEIQAETGHVFVTFGDQIQFRNIACLSFDQRAPSTNVTLINPKVLGTVKLAGSATVIQPSISTFDVNFNAADIQVTGGSITNPINFTNNIRGSITFSGCKIADVQDTKNPATGYSAVTFQTCTFVAFTGSFNAEAEIDGGYVAAASLASQSRPRFDGTVFGSFGYTGNTGFITRNCRCIGSASWTPPANVNYPRGTLTERVGYNAAGKLYQNTDDAVAWSVLA